MVDTPTPGAVTEAGPLEQKRILIAGTVSVSWLIIIACVHMMYVGFVLFGSKPRTAAVLASLTQNGRQWYLPERELPIYILGCAAGLALSLVAAISWQRIARARELEHPGYTLRGMLVSLLIAVIGSGFNLSWILATNAIGKLLGLPHIPVAIVMLLPAVAELVLFYLSQKRSFAERVRSLFSHNASEIKAVSDRFHADEPSDSDSSVSSSNSQKHRYRIIDVCVVVFICSVIYIPRTDLLAGKDFLFQHFHHWDFFAMGPAIGLLKGRHLATQVYCQYGFGWPLILAKLDPVYRLTYGHAYKIAIIYGCIYYCGLYWLLRRLLPNPAWAIAGLALALRLQVFHSGEQDIPLWFIPGYSILRSPCDIWILVLMLSHRRKPQPALLVIAGGLVGLSLLFEIDTGVYLTIVFAAYCSLWVAAAVNSETRRGRVWLSLFSFMAAAIVLLAGMTAASGSAVFTTGYIRQWLEVLWLYPSGISMQPIIRDPAGLMLSYWLILFFLAHTTAGVLRFSAGIRDAQEVLATSIAALGLLYLVYYIGNSHAYSILQLSTPFCIVAVYTGERFGRILGRLIVGFRPEYERYTAKLVAAVCTIVLLSNPQLRGYPSLLRSIFVPAPKHVACYFADLQDVCVATGPHSNVEPFQLAVSEMRAISNQGKSVAVISNDDTALYVASRSTLWNRYTPLLPPLMTQSMLAGVDRELSTRPVDYVFLRKTDPSKDGFWAGMLPPLTTDSWTRLGNTTRRLYHFDHICGPYEVWRR